MKIKEILQRSTSDLQPISESSALDASLLLSKVTGYSKVELFLKDEEDLSAEQLKNFEMLLQRRLKSEPMAYILGEKEFWGLRFEVVPGVLIPRPDTETLVATLLALIPNTEYEGKVADLGTGSGAILLSILSELPHFKGVGVDKNDTALQIAQKNAKNLELDERSIFVHSHWLDSVDDSFDVVVSNPPYIETSTIQGLMEDVKGFEPLSALDGGEDGLDCYRSLLKSAYGKLRKGGLLLLEIGYNQRESVAQLLQSYKTDADEGNAFEQIECFKDLSGNDRVIAAIKVKQ